MDSGLGFVQPMFFVGVVEDRNDPRVEGRVRVRAFGVHGSNKDISTEELPWATLIIGNHDVNFTPPPLNAWVFGFFIDGRDAQQPMILGLIPSQASGLIDPNTRGWGSVPAENYDRESQGARPRDLGLSPMSRLATGEFLNETYNEALETNRVRDIPIAGGCARGHNAVGNGNAWSNDIGETANGGGQASTRTSSATEQEIYQGLRARGVPDAAARGIIANMIHESRLEPGINEAQPLIKGSAGGFGLIQWTGPRRRTLEAEAQRRGAPVNSLDFQLDFLVDELRGPQRGSYDRMLRTNDPVEAARVFYAFNLRPAVGGRIVGDQARLENFPRTPRFGEAQRLAQTQFETSPPTSESNRLLEARTSRQDLVDSQRVLTQADISRTEINRLAQERDSLGTTAVDAAAREQLNEQIRQKEAELAALDTSIPTEGTSEEPYSGYANPSSDPSCASTWEEPPSGYSARYPYNRVIETASGHSIELDDTPGGERIMIWHRDGSYVQITGTSTTHKNMSDAYHINERNNHVFIGGNNIVTIEGDSYVLIKGDKVEEIEGNYKQIVHGNVQIGGGGRVEINGADRTDIRSASLSLDSNVENLNIRTGKNIVFESGESFNVKSKNVRLGASENMSVTGQKGLFLQSQGGDVHVKSDGNVFLNPDQNLFLRTEGGTISAEAKGSIRFNSSGSFISINSSSYMSLGSKGEMLIGSEGGSLNLNSSDKMGITASDLFLNGSSDVNVTGGQNVNITGGSDLNVKAGGAAYVSSGAVLNLLAGSDARLTGSNVHIKGSTVFIDDIVQLANGSADDAVEAETADTKEPIDPSRFGDGTGEMGGEVAAQAQQAQLPTNAQSEALGIPTPPDRSVPPILNVIPRQPTNQSSGNPIVNREATIPGALPLNETTIIGTMGTTGSPRALIRDANGVVGTFRVGETFQGRTIVAINPSSGEVTFQGENAFSTRTLRVPQ